MESPGQVRWRHSPSESILHRPAHSPYSNRTACAKSCTAPPSPASKRRMLPAAHPKLTPPIAPKQPKSRKPPPSFSSKTPANTFSGCFKYCTLTVHSTTSKEPSPQRLSSCSRMHTTLLHPQTCSRTIIAASPSRGETLPGQNSIRSKPLRAQLQGDPFLGCHFPQPLNAIAIGDASLTLQPF
jgi:hypothetical protein